MLIACRRGIVALGIAGLMVACGDGSGPTDTDPRTAVINGTVTEDGSGVQGVGVSLSGAASRSTTTDASGAFRFENLAAGTYQVTISVPTGFVVSDGDETVSVQLAAGGTSSVAFALLEDDGTPPHVVDLRDLLFDPDDLTIQAGETVLWVNREAVVHNVTPEGHSEWTAATLNTTGDEFQHTFDETGDFPYECTLHPGMEGIIRVEAAGDPAPTS